MFEWHSLGLHSCWCEKEEQQGHHWAKKYEFMTLLFPSSISQVNFERLQKNDTQQILQDFHRKSGVQSFVTFIIAHETRLSRHFFFSTY